MFNILQIVSLSGYRGRCIFKVLVFSQQQSNNIRKRHNCFSDKSGNSQDVILRSIPCNEIGSIKCFRLRFSGFILGFINGRKKIHNGIGRFDPTFTSEYILPGIPEPVRHSPLKNNGFALPYILCLLSKNLITKFSFNNR